MPSVCARYSMFSSLAGTPEIHPSALDSFLPVIPQPLSFIWTVVLSSSFNAVPGTQVD